MIEDSELEARLIYAVIVAGKSAKFTSGVMNRFDAHRQRNSPFAFVRTLIEEENLDWMVRDIRAGNYTKIARCLRELVTSNIDLRTCTPEQLEEIHGIGPKTARFFILWTRPEARYAALDIHILRWLRMLGHDAPVTTPNGAKYRKLENIFLAEADKRGLTPSELDARIWDEGANGANAVGGAQQQLL